MGEIMRSMKNSGIEWVGDIPDNWGVEPNKYLMKKEKNICPIYKGEPILSLTMKGVIERDLDAGGKMPSSFDGYQYVKAGSLLLCLFDIDVTPRCSGLVIKSGVTSPAYSQFVMKNKAYAPYYNYYYTMVDDTKELLHMAKNLRHSLNEEQFGAIKAPVPPIEEQRKIAEFLDEKCGEIDALIADIKTQIESLEQYKRSVITEAVTKGLNPSAEMKDSGAGWMPTVPKHWAVEKFKFHLHIKAQKNMGDKQVLSLYRDYGVVPKDSRDDNHNVTSEDTSTYRFVRVGDFVVNKMKAWQGSVAVSQYEGIVSPAYFVYEFTDNLFNKQYFHYLLRNKSYTTEFMRLSGGIRVGQWDLPAEALENILVLIPPIEEQKQIADYLDNKCAQIDELKSQKQSQIETLEAYKKSIIYEYVTGKKEVG